MATRGSFWLRGKKGKLAGTTVYTSKGRTIQREIVAVSNPQTRAQMTQRVKWPNLVNTYKLLKSLMKYAFESKKGAQSDYNALMSVNASAASVPAITKSMARQGFVVPFGYQITMGSLGTFTAPYDAEAGSFVANIATGDVKEITDNTTIGELSAGILSSMPNLREGMQISYVMVYMPAGLDAEGNPTQVTMIKVEFLLDKASTDKVKDFVGGYVDINESGMLTGFYDESIPFAGAFIVSETRNGKTAVSSEKLVLNAAAKELADQFTSEAAYNAAIDSYGVQEVAFLNSNEAKKA